jgi:hypothetical protein
MRLSPPLTSLIVTWPFGATSDDPRLVGVVQRERLAAPVAFRLARVVRAMQAEARATRIIRGQ